MSCHRLRALGSRYADDHRHLVQGELERARTCRGLACGGGCSNGGCGLGCRLGSGGRRREELCISCRSGSLSEIRCRGCRRGLVCRRKGKCLGLDRP